MGSEVDALVNEEQARGKYDVEFDGSNLMNGMYSFRLQVYPASGGAGDPVSSLSRQSWGAGQVFVETKKMI